MFSILFNDVRDMTRLLYMTCQNNLGISQLENLYFYILSDNHIATLQPALTTLVAGS